MSNSVIPKRKDNLNVIRILDFEEKCYLVTVSSEEIDHSEWNVRSGILEKYDQLLTEQELQKEVKPFISRIALGDIKVNNIDITMRVLSPWTYYLVLYGVGIKRYPDGRYISAENLADYIRENDYLSEIMAAKLFSDNLNSDLDEKEILSKITMISNLSHCVNLS